ncbi:MAG TPA: PAS domain S-box protein [Candidatus Methanofastidiosum sp.]|nr:PAS domain S-box protein [Methanofastidiosum sp.]
MSNFAIPVKPEIPKEIMDKWQKIVDLMAKIVGVPAGLIMKVDPPQIEVFISSKTEKNPYHKGEKANLNTGLYCETVMQKRESLLVPDATKDPNWDNNPDIPLGMIYYLGFPLEWPNGEIFGTICVLDYKDNPKAIAFNDLIKEFKTIVETDLDNLLKNYELEHEKERLKESERKYSLLFNRMLSGFALHEIILDKNGIPCDFRFLDINPQFEAIIGIKRKEIIGKTVLGVFPKTEKYWIETYGKVALEGIPARFSQYSLEFNKYFDVSAFSPEKGKFATLFLDITGQKKLEERLKESSLIINTSNIMLFTWKNEKNWPVEFVSENVLNIMGYAPEDFVSGKVYYSNCIHPDDLSRVFQEVKKFSEEKDRTEFIHEPYRIITKEGNVLVVSDWTFIIRNSEGIITHYKGIIQDITEKKKTEDALKQSEKKYRELVENANSIIAKYDKKGTIISMNEYGLKFFGYTEDEIIGKNFIGTITPKIESTGRHLDDFLLEVFSNIEKYPQNINENIKKNGERVWVLWTNRPIKDENDNLIGLFSVGTDVTDRKKAEDTVKGLNETLSILNKILRHDILNDLTVVMSACDMIQVDDQRLKQKATKAIMKSVSLIEQMRSLENALVSEEVLAGKSLGSIVESVVNNYPHIKFSIKGDCTVLCDGAIYSAIDNIVRNAVVHGKTDRIDISIHEKDGRCELRIADYGKGIPLDIKDKIFEEGESFGDTRGSGLGLYIVKKVMERYGGEISVEDNKPSGAMFVLKLKKA